MAESNLTMADMHTDEIISVKIVINGYEITQENRFFKSVTINTGCTQDGYISYGGTFSPSCTISMQDHELIQNGTFFEIYFKIQNQWEHFGKFKVNQEPQRADDLVDFSAEGMISAVFDNAELYVPKEMRRRLNGIREIVEKLETVTGIEIEIEESLTNGAQSMIFPAKAEDVLSSPSVYRDTLRGYPARGLLGEVAFLLGGNAVERNGRIYIEDASRKSSTQTVMFGKDTYSDCTISKKTYAPRPVKVSFQDVSVEANVEPGGKTYNYYCYTSEDKKVYRLDSSWGSSEGRPDITYDLVIESDLAGFNIGSSHGPGPGGLKLWNWTGKNPRPYRPFEADFCGYHPQITAGNDIIIEDETGTGQQVYCDTVTYEWDGGMSIKAASSFNASVGGGTNASTITSSASGTATQIIGVRNEVASFKSVYADYVEANSAKINALETNSITTDNLAANVSQIGKLEADDAIVRALFSDSIIADTAVLERLQTNILSTEKISSLVAEISSLTADDAFIKNIFSDKIISNEAITNIIKTHILDADVIRAATSEFGYMTAENADIKYANITLGNIDTAKIDKAKIGILLNEIGLIDRATIVDGHITGFLDAVEINAKSITVGTMIADRLLLRGSEEGLLFALNNLGELVSKNVDSLDGDILTERSISAEKMIAKSITTTELDTEQVFADMAVLKKIFAQDIEATGTITGVKLKGVHIEAGTGKIGNFFIMDGNLSGSTTDTTGNHHAEYRTTGVTVSKETGGTSTYESATISSDGLSIITSKIGGAENTIADINPKTGIQVGENGGNVIKISDMQMKPTSDNTGSVGTSSNRWANVYAVSIHGNLDGNATKDGDGNIISSTYMKKSDGIGQCATFYPAAASTLLQQYSLINMSAVLSSTEGYSSYFRSNGSSIQILKKGVYVVDVCMYLMTGFNVGDRLELMLTTGIIGGSKSDYSSSCWIYHSPTYEQFALSPITLDLDPNIPEKSWIHVQARNMTASRGTYNASYRTRLTIRKVG